MTGSENVYEERLGTDRMLPLVLKMALPAVAAQVVNLLYNIVDRIYIGHIPGIGTDALAGVGVTSSVIILISAFSAIVSGGGAPLAAIALGQGNRDRAERILGNGFILLILFTVIISALSYIFMEPVLLFTGASGNTIGYATDYLSIYLTGTVFVQISVGLNTFINTQGRPGIAMLSTILGAVMNIILDPIFIFALDILGGDRSIWFRPVLVKCANAMASSMLTSMMMALAMMRAVAKTVSMRTRRSSLPMAKILIDTIC